MADEVSHTPGPWQVDEVRTSCGRAYRIGAGEMLKADKGCCIIYDDYPVDGDNERAANARLIAAAPELLEALKSISYRVINGRPYVTFNMDKRGFWSLPIPEHGGDLIKAWSAKRDAALSKATGAAE